MYPALGVSLVATQPCSRKGRNQMSSPKLTGISHVKARRDQKELDIRFVFDGRPPFEATVSFDAVERMAGMFDQLARAVRLEAPEN
jgi:poly(3-hydroxybutyrate) depolymerase